MLLVDTNIVSFIFKNDSRAGAYASWLANEQLAIAFVTAAELYKWPLERGWGKERRAALERLIRTYAVLPYDDALCRVWARLMADNKRQGRVRTYPDSWIAATAVRHGLVLITHNPRDFANIEGLTVRSKAPDYE